MVGQFCKKEYFENTRRIIYFYHQNFCRFCLILDYMKEIKSSQEDIRIYKAIHQILRYDWNPIGLDESGPEGEYNGYLPIIFELKIHKANRNTIAEKLFEFEIELGTQS